MAQMQMSIERARGLLAASLVLWSAVAGGCARLPYTTYVVHEDQRVRVVAQREVEPAGYSHPVQLSVHDLVSILRGLSIREGQRLPLRWFAEETPPKPLFRTDEISVLAPVLAKALAKVGPDERVHFEVIAPGLNPASRHDVTAGWLAVREAFLYFTPEYFHAQVPIRKSDPYDYNYPTPPPLAKDYLVYFEPGRYWVTDERGRRALDYRQFLKSAQASGSGDAPPVPPAEPR